MPILFKDFLDNPIIYAKTENYWKKILLSIAQKQNLFLVWQWRNTFLPNAQKIYDGNPIATAYFPDLKKGIRIIQEPFFNEQYKIKAWLHTTEYQDEKIVELVIGIQLSNQTQKIAEELIADWIVEDKTGLEMEKKIKTEIEYFKLQSQNQYKLWFEESKKYVPYHFLDVFMPCKSQKDQVRAAVEIYGTAIPKQIKTIKFPQKYFRANPKTNRFYLWTWLKVADYLTEREEIGLFSFEQEENLIETLKIRLHENNLFSTIKNVLLEYGIKLIVLPLPKGLRADGAVFWQNGNPVIVLAKKNRPVRADHFVFTLFHELGHLFKHLSKDENRYFVDNEEEKVEDRYEKEADKYAQNRLIRTNQWQKFIAQQDFSFENIDSFAQKLGIPAFVVAGRLKFEKKIKLFDFSHINY